MSSTRRLLLWIALCAPLAGAGCKQGLGDRCEQNSDCSSGFCSVQGSMAGGGNGTCRDMPAPTGGGTGGAGGAAGDAASPDGAADDAAPDVEGEAGGGAVDAPPSIDAGFDADFDAAGDIGLDAPVD